MVAVFFFYGLSFFVLGLVVLIYPKRGSIFKLAGYLNLLAGFGLVHGVNEWIDMFLLIGAGRATDALYLARLVTLPVSFLFLLRLGTKGLCEFKKDCLMLRAVPLILGGVWLAVVAFSSNRLLMADIWARYLLCVPGTALTAAALVMNVPELKREKLKKAGRNVLAASGVLLVYGLLAGTVVQKAQFWPASVLNHDSFRSTAGMPVQVFRAACAAVVAYNTIRMLNIFRWESRKRLQQTELRFATVANAAPVVLFMGDLDRGITFVQGKGLEALGLKESDVLGQPASKLFPGLDLDPEVLSRTKNAKVAVGEAVFDVVCSPMGDEESGGGFIGVGIDITRRIRVRAELEQYREQLLRTQRLTELGTMSAAMGQELTRPLSVAKLLLERLIGAKHAASSEEDRQNTLRNSYTQVSEAAKILRRFCDSAQIQPKGGSPIDIYGVARRVAAIFRERAAVIGLELEVRETYLVPSLLIAERELEYVLSMVIEYVLDSAEQPACGKITVNCRQAEDMVEIGVSGPIRAAAAHIQETFAPFAAGVSSDRDSGLGLAVVKQILDSRGGGIEIDDSSETETLFIIRVPAA